MSPNARAHVQTQVHGETDRELRVYALQPALEMLQYQVYDEVHGAVMLTTDDK